MRNAPVVDQRVEEMYSMYQAGESLAGVAKAFDRSRQAVWELFKNRKLPVRAPREHLPPIFYRGTKYTMRNTGYYGATSGNRHLLHRRIWADANGPIPDQHDIHHKDEIKTHNALTNLECLPKADHTRLYSPSCNQFSHKCGKEAHEPADRFAL